MKTESAWRVENGELKDKISRLEVDVEIYKRQSDEWAKSYEQLLRRHHHLVQQLEKE